MKIWKLGVSQGYQRVLFDNSMEEQDVIINCFYGETAGEIPIMKYKNNDGKYIVGDAFDLLSRVCLISKRAMEVLKDIIGEKAEYIPGVHIELNEMLFLVNVTNVIEALNYEKSSFTRFRTGKILRIDSYSFLEHLVLDQHIFKLKENRGSIFVSDTFKNVVESNGLLGFSFEEVWNSNEDEVNEMEAKYQSLLETINNQPGEKYSYGEAQKLVDQGAAVVSGEWKMQLNRQGKFVIGRLNDIGDGTYFWMQPAYIPPVLLSLKWQVENIEL